MKVRRGGLMIQRFERGRASRRLDVTSRRGVHDDEAAEVFLAVAPVASQQAIALPRGMRANEEIGVRATLPLRSNALADCGDAGG